MNSIVDVAGLIVGADSFMAGVVESEAIAGAAAENVLLGAVDIPFIKGFPQE
jgi:hypothetical protein